MAPSVTSSTVPQQPLRKAGHLYKKTGLGRSWKPRYFSLEGNVLYYYKREGDSIPKGIVVMTGCIVKLTKDKKYYSFRISHPKTSTVFDLAATLQSRTEDWMEILQEAAEQAPTSVASQMPAIGQPSMWRSDSVMERPSMMEFANSSSSNIVTDVEGLEEIYAPDVHVPEEYHDHLDGLMIEFLRQAHPDAEGWKLQTEQRGVKAYVRTASRLGSFKGVGFINHPPRAVLDLVLDLPRRHSFDPQLQSTERVYVYDDHTFIDHLVYKEMFPMSARDFVNITHWRVLPNGSILLVATAIDREDLVPSQEPKVVRGNVIMAGFLLEPNADYTGVQATYITKADVKVGIHSSLQTKVFIKQAFVIDEIRKELDEDDTLEQVPRGRITNKTVFHILTTGQALDEDEEVVSYHSMSTETTDRDHDHDHEHDHDEPALRETFTIPEVGLPSVPPKYHDMIEKVLARMDEELNDEASWQFHSEKQGVMAYTRIDGSLTAAKGVGFVPIHPRAIWDMICDCGKRKTYDSQLSIGMQVATLDGQTSIGYFEYKPVFVVAGRDFCTLTHWRVLNDGTIVIVAQSVEDLALAPLKEPKVVRGEVHLACWKIEPNSNYDGALVSYMIKTDLKGNIPSRIASKAAAEQPYLISKITEILKKSRTLDLFASAGKLKNTLLDHPMKERSLSMASMVSTKSRTSSKTNSSGGTANKLSAAPEQVAVAKPHMEEPEVEAPVLRRRESKPSSSHKRSVSIDAPKRVVKTVADLPKSHFAKEADVMETRPRNRPDHNTPELIVFYGVQFGVAMLALKSLSLPAVLHFGVVGFLMFYFGVLLFLGPAHMSPRRKLMIASFGAPDSGMILGTLTLDMSKTQKYIEDKRAATDSHLTITHIVLRAIGMALAESPSVNGHLVFGNYYPAKTVDVSCLIAVNGGKDLGVCHLSEVDKMSFKDVCGKLRGDATKVRGGEDQGQKDRNKMLNILPTYIVRPITNLVGWLGGACGLRIPAFGVEPYMFGACMVTSVGMMGLDMAFAPITPYAQTPMLLTIGAIQDKVVVVDNEIVIRPMLTITTTIDHRYVDGSQAARMASMMKKLVEDPSLLEPANA